MRFFVVIFFVAFIFVTDGCAREERIVSVSGILAPQQRAKLGLKEERPRAEWQKGQDEFALVDAEGNPLNPLRVTRENGSVVLISKSPRYVILHLREMLISGELELLHDQLLSEYAKKGLTARGRESWMWVEELSANRREVLKLLARMPRGELTPGLVMKPMGGGVYRLKAPRRRDRKFSSIDFIWEGGMCKLVYVK